ncbi:putative SOS response-associated peptidase YoqW [Pullulanibacillus camelliae]|uniref:Abasic site processing protein n=1 Tax=Pullulanibacillus camelliae TaxID=1707096 RepID=A0A8J2YIK9_9BACL|nr:SOS response-associated peptidase [Pullulanibacillus camelliae]GGE45514.1 putative SOS response-associated peptidase YoqW [Pullulanibacillus camelliae]
MCGRFTLTCDLKFLMERFQISYPTGFQYDYRYNIAPSQNVTVVIRGQQGNKMGQLRWGFVPPWAKDPSVGFKMINARAETAAMKPSFRSALKNQRCLILADGFYEWKQEEAKKKRPFRITLKEREAFAFAGLWSMWEKDGEKLATCTILTTEANALMSNLHHRMPVILPKEAEDIWLDPRTDLQTITSLLQQYPAEQMTYYEVSDAVNSAKNDAKDLLAPVEGAEQLKD